MAKHDKNTSRNDSKTAMAHASHPTSPGKRSVMTEPRGGEAGKPKVQFPGKAVMEESQEKEKGFKRGGRTHSSARGVQHQPKAPGVAHSHGPALPSAVDSPIEDINDMPGKAGGGEVAYHEKHGGRAGRRGRKEGGMAHDDGMAAKRMDKPARKARGGATTMRGRSPLSSAHETSLPTRANTH